MTNQAHDSGFNSKLIQYLEQETLRDASKPEVEGSYIAGNPMVSDGSEILAYNPEKIIIKDQKIKIVRPSEEFLRKVNDAWSVYKQTEKGKNSFNGPIITVKDHKSNGKDFELEIKLTTYADFAMSYKPQFSAEEKRENYSLGVSSILLTSDNQYIFGIRPKNISAAAGSIDKIGGFLGLNGLIDPSLETQIKAYCKEDTFWNKVGNEIPAEIDVNLDMHKTFNLEKHEEIGTIEKDLMKVQNKAVAKVQLYQNYDIIDLVNLAIDEKTVRKRFENSDKEISRLIFVPKKNLPEFIMKHMSEITPSLRYILNLELRYT